MTKGKKNGEKKSGKPAEIASFDLHNARKTDRLI